MGTRARVVLHASDEPSAAAAASAAFAEMDRLERVMSDYDQDSEAMRLCALPAGDWHSASDDLLDVLSRSREVWEATEGAFDPTVGTVSVLWREARRDGRAPDPAAIGRAMSRVGMDKIEIDPDSGVVRFASEGMRLDFGGIGKGYAADRALAALRGLGHDTSLVELGGDMAVGAPPPGRRGWRVSIRDGVGSEREMLVHGVGVATSGDLEQHVEIGGVRYSHILDPRTGEPLTTPVATTVIAPSAWLADALASASSVLGPDGLEAIRRRWPAAEFAIVTPATASPGPAPDRGDLLFRASPPSDSGD